MDDKQKKAVVILGVLIVVAVLFAFVGKSAAPSGETVTDFKRVPPKGIGKLGGKD